MFPSNTNTSFSCSIPFPHNTSGQRISMRAKELILHLLDDDDEEILKPCKILLSSQQHNIKKSVFCMFCVSKKDDIYEQYGKANLVESFYTDIGTTDIPGFILTLSFKLETIDGYPITLRHTRPTILCLEFVCHSTDIMPSEFAITFSSSPSTLHSEWTPYNFLRDLPEDLKQKDLWNYEVALESVWIPTITKDQLIKMSINNNVITINLSGMSSITELLGNINNEVANTTNNFLRFKPISTESELGFVIKLKDRTKDFFIEFDVNFRNFFRFAKESIMMNAKKTVFLHKVSSPHLEAIKSELKEIIESNMDAPIVGLTCDVIQNVFLNQKSIPILKTIDITKTNQLHSFHLSPIFYACKASRHPTFHFTFVSLQTNKTVKFNTDGPIYITLLFRHRQ